MISKKPVKQNAFKFSWQNDPTKSTNLADDFHAMRDWQVPAFELLKNSHKMILNAPMGSGKSWMMCLLSAFKMRQNKSLRTLIAVPQTIIAPGFLEAKIEMPDGERIHWKIKNNLCANEKPNIGIVNYIIKWLSDTSYSPNNQTIICTHATLVALFKKLKALNKLVLLNNLLIWIDEAHHVKNVPIEGFEGAILNNGLGELVAYALSSKEFNIEIGLTTASFYRGDRYSLLTPEMELQFQRFNLPYDEYLKSMKYLKSFNIDFLLCGSNYCKAMELIINERQGKDIIYIPHPVSQHSSGNKYKEVDNIIAAYQTIHGSDTHISADGVRILNKNDKTFKILDLVNEKLRPQKKEFLSTDKQKNDLDLIIALGMFKEGANWIWADRSIIVGSRSSLVDIIQMIGRLFRDAEGKEHVEVIQLLPFALDQKDEAGFKENLNNYLKALYASLILENILNPVKIKTKDKAQKIEDELTSYNFSETNKNWLEIAIPDDAKQLTIIEDITAQLVEIGANNKDIFKQTSLLREEYRKIVPRILEQHGITDHKEEVASQIWNMFTRRSLNIKGIAAENINFEILQNADPLDYLLRYTSGICNIDTLQKLRAAIQITRGQWKTFEDTKAFVINLKLKSETEWQLYISNKIPHLPSLPNDIPKAPWAAYPQEWISMGDFLGTNLIAPKLREYLSYEDARAFAQNLNLKRKDDWPLYTKGQIPGLPPLPANIPACPDKTYKRKNYGSKWNGWGDFLGTKRISNQNKSKAYRPYIEAQLFVQNLNLKTAKDWLNYINDLHPNLPTLPSDIPKSPDDAYNEWINWPTFLGSEISKFNCQRSFFPFNVARELVHKLGLKKQKDWVDYCTGRLSHLPPKPLEIPSNPEKKYKNQGWKSTQDWLGY